jgi:hypothetical protein
MIAAVGHDKGIVNPNPIVVISWKVIGAACVADRPKPVIRNGASWEHAE